MKTRIHASRILGIRGSGTRHQSVTVHAVKQHLQYVGKSFSKLTKTEQEFIRFWTSKRGQRFLNKSAELFGIMCGERQDILVQAYRYIVKLYMDMVLSEGLLEASRKLKAIYSLSLRYSAEHEFERLPYLKSGDDGLPTKLGPLIPLLKGKLASRTAALYILSIYKLHVETIDDVVNTTIIEGNKLGSVNTKFKDDKRFYLDILRSNTELSNEDNDLITTFWRNFDIELQLLFPYNRKKKRLESLATRSQLHLTSRNGPNGQAVKAGLLDIKLLLESHLKDDFIELAQLTGNTDLLAVIEDVIAHDMVIQPKDDKQPLCLSRLRIKSEPGGKGRLFAILDYGTQSVMTGIHKHLYRVLDTLKEDGTSSHDRVAEEAKLWSQQNVEIYSADLSAATDRFPALLQKYVISWIFGNKVGQHWFNLMTDRQFYLNGQDLRFNVGQPLGALSSWAAFALTHHIVVRACKRTLQPSDSNELDYRIIGDDIIIKGRSLHELYHKIMTQFLEVTINPIKGYSPETLKSRGITPDGYNVSSVVEVAKRVFVNGVEITPISPVLCRDGLELSSSFPDLLREINRRLEFSSEDQPPAVRLAGLCFKPKQALLHATFPIFPAPLTGLTETSWYDKRDVYPDVTWFNQGFKAVYMLEYLFLDELRRLANSESLIDQIKSKDINSLIKSDGSIILSHWLYTTSSSHMFLNLIQNRCVNRVLDYYFDYPYKDIVVKIKDPISNELIPICPSRAFLLEQRGLGSSVALKEFIGLKKIVDQVEEILKGNSSREEPDQVRRRLTSTLVMNISRRLKAQ